MLISTKGTYALSVMIDLAEHEKDGYIALSDIAERQGMSKKYLEAIIKDLVKVQMVKGVRGKGGGYKLNVDPAKCTAWDVIRATEENFSPVSCVTDDHTTCPNQTVCRTLPMWTEYDNMVHEFFYSKKLSDLLEQPDNGETQPE